MLKRYWLGTVLAFALILSASCSTLNVGNSSPERDTAEAFSLNVMDESFFNGSTVEGITTTTKEERTTTR